MERSAQFFPKEGSLFSAVLFGWFTGHWGYVHFYFLAGLPACGGERVNRGLTI